MVCQEEIMKVEILSVAKNVRIPVTCTYEMRGFPCNFVKLDLNSKFLIPLGFIIWSLADGSFELTDDSANAVLST